jgi:hypothetical protein
MRPPLHSVALVAIAIIAVRHRRTVVVLATGRGASAAAARLDCTTAHGAAATRHSATTSTPGAAAGSLGVPGPFWPRLACRLVRSVDGSGFAFGGEAGARADLAVRDRHEVGPDPAAVP